MREVHGEAAEQILVEGAPHVMVFPNLFIAEIQVFVIQPVSAGECVQHSTAVQLKGAPELNRRMVSQSVGSVGPAGMLLADDTEMYERNQRGVAMLRPEWLDLRRGLQRERLDERGLKVGTATDETGMRGFWSHYLSLMGRGGVTAPAGQDLDLRQIEQFLYREARYADEHDYDAWEALWTDDAIYWVPAGGDLTDPGRADVGDLRQPEPDRHPAEASCAPASGMPSPRRPACAG
jgi:hypothetical protein